MRRSATQWYFVVGTVLLATSGGASANAQNASGAPASFISPAAKQRLDHCIQALGGKAFEQWRSLWTSGRVFLMEDNSTAGFAPFKSTEAPPDKRRFTYGSGSPVTLINDGKQGWEIDRYGVIRQTPQQVEAWRLANRYSLENILRVGIRAPGILAEDKGLAIKDNQPVDEIEIIDSRQVHIELYLDEDTSLPREVSYRVYDPGSRTWQTYSEVYSDYQTFQGIETPMHLTRYQNGQRVAELFRDKARYDVPIPASLFSQPR